MEDLGKRTLKDLMTLARERFGAGAASLKTRAELVAALTAQPSAEPAPVKAPEAAPTVELVTSDFFRRRA
ncbi:MAG: hypothetical protein QM817_08805 [Archangium sp.]